MKAEILICSLLYPQCPNSAWHTVDARPRFLLLFAMHTIIHGVTFEHECPQLIEGSQGKFYWGGSIEGSVVRNLLISMVQWSVLYVLCYLNCVFAPFTAAGWKTAPLTRYPCPDPCNLWMLPYMAKGLCGFDKWKILRWDYPEYRVPSPGSL